MAFQFHGNLLTRKTQGMVPWLVVEPKELGLDLSGKLALGGKVWGKKLFIGEGHWFPFGDHWGTFQG